MKSVETLISLSRKKLEEKKKIIVALERQKDSYCQILQNLQEELAREQQFIDLFSKGQIENTSTPASNGLIFYYDSYFSGNTSKQKKTKNQIDRLEQQMESLRKELQEIFLEMKKFEILNENRLLQKAQEKKRKEEEELQEVALSHFNKLDD